MLANSLDIRKEVLYSKHVSVPEWMPRAAKGSLSLEMCEAPLYKVTLSSEFLHLTLNLAVC